MRQEIATAKGGNMRKLLIAIFILATTACHAQVRSSPSSDARAVENTRTIQNEILQRNEKLRKEMDAAVSVGKELFGAGILDNDYNGPIDSKRLVDYKIGDWGRVPRVATVLSVLNKDTVLVKLKEKLEEGNGGDIDIVVMFKGFDTSKITSNAKFVMPHPIRISKTQSYDAVAGSRETVLVLERDDKFIAGQVDAIRAERARKDAFKKVKGKSGAVGAAVYDSFPEDVRAQLIRDWELERDALERAIEEDRKRFAQAKSPKEKARLTELIAKYKSKLAAHKKNNPPYIK